ncbi:10153_t:CDS:2 [Paraglomus occultum]|uniref:10153_t:CDS:1 n=1 Tax=Paraglomus occultum TaxID=144539 RepID=A0A9N9FGX0_9GLOM|nr:10153_t:CDS:2 [Paraglomus occultum]
MTDLTASNLFSVKGKVALVTGGGTGIGYMIAKALVCNGANVYIVSRKIKVLEKAASSLNELGPGKCTALQANLKSKAACEQVALELGAREDKLHILVNNSGVGWAAKLENIPESSWDHVNKVNLYAVYYLTMACLPLLVKANQGPKDPARVLIIGSIGGLLTEDFNRLAKPPANTMSTLSYAVSKAAVHHLATTLATHLTPRGVNVNVIAPGTFPTKITESRDDKLVNESTPIGRIGLESDMAGAVLYLSSPAGAFVTGAVLVSDGGTMLSSVNKVLAKI